MRLFKPVKSLIQLQLITYLIFALGCASHAKSTLYEQIGGADKVALIADLFIDEIEFDKAILAFFRETNVDRFREKFIEHLCVNIDGPCNYSGDDMIKVHAGMNISEAEFNRVVELLINAMKRAELPYPLQNQILARLAPMRGEIIYR